MRVIFVSYFFNTGILMLLVNSRGEAHNQETSNLFSPGDFYDYSPKWYSIVGSQLINTMLFSVFTWPISDFLVVCLAFVKQTIDNGFRCCQSQSKRLEHTNKSTIYEYINLYEGP